MLPEYRCWAEVDLDAIRTNLAWIRHRVGSQVKIITVVKADAYGHGLKPIASTLMQHGTDIFGVANLAEARAVRSVGRGWPILMLGPCLPHEVPLLVKDHVMPTISSLEEARAFSACATDNRSPVDIHVKVDTGMGRLGMRAEMAVGLVKKIRSLPGIRIQGIYTHYSSAEDDEKVSTQQAETFRRVVDVLAGEESTIPLVHASNSAALLHGNFGRFNVVRPGLLVYGVIPPGKRRMPEEVIHRQIEPALSWKCRVGFLKEVPKGTPLSYGRTFVTRRKTRVATVTAGYGDGYQRAGSNRSEVLIGGRRCRVLGRVTMDQMLVDVTAMPKVCAGDEVVLIGRQRDQSIDAVEVAAWFDTVPWEVLTGITYRVPRVYRGGTAA